VSDFIGLAHRSSPDAARALGLAMLVAGTNVVAAATWFGCSGAEGGGAADLASTDGGEDSARSAPMFDAALVDGARESATTIDGGDAGDTLMSTPACIKYCNTMQAMCSVDYPQFETTHSCLVACSYYPPGTPADSDYSGNTLKCRQTHTQSAGGHCLHGGPFGYGDCGFMCEGFCQIAMAWCAKSAGGAPFASAAACSAECEAWPWAPNGPDGAAAFRATTPTTGDTLDCREVQLVKSLASSAARDVYCPLAATNSATCR